MSIPADIKGARSGPCVEATHLTPGSSRPPCQLESDPMAHRPLSRVVRQAWPREVGVPHGAKVGESGVFTLPCSHWLASPCRRLFWQRTTLPGLSDPPAARGRMLLVRTSAAAAQQPLGGAGPWLQSCSRNRSPRAVLPPGGAAAGSPRHYPPRGHLWVPGPSLWARSPPEITYHHKPIKTGGHHGIQTDDLRT